MSNTLGEINERDKIIKRYLETIEIMNRNTDSYMFLFDIQKDENWFFGNIDKNYAVRKEGSLTNKTAEMVEIVYPADRAMLEEDLRLISEGKKKVHDMNYRWINRNGDVVWISCRGSVINDENGRPFVMIGRVSDIVLTRVYNPVTGLFNKIKMLNDFREGSFPNSNCLMLIEINNLFGESMQNGGKYCDRLLKFLVSVLEKYVSPQRMYHVDYDRFALLLEVESDTHAEQFFETIQNDVSEKCTVSAGVVPFDMGLYIDENTVYDFAVQTLLESRERGGDTITFYNEDLLFSQISAIELLEEMEESVRNNYEGFHLVYQPQMKAGSYEIYGAEVLIRYQSKKQGQIGPSDFIPLLEKTGIIKNVGMWVLENALMQCRIWRKKCPDFHISVNFSTVQLQDKFIVPKIIEKLCKARMPGEALTVEITESVQLQENEHFVAVMKLLKAEGVDISIDDFGTGYSNIAYLKQIYADEIKLDRLFVSSIQDNTYNYNLVANIISFAKANSLRVCCEGVEDINELLVLESYAPDSYQGYLFSKPCSAEIFEKTFIETGTDEHKEYQNFVRKLYDYKEKSGFIYFDTKDILRDTGVGLWIMRISKEDKYFELHADDTMERIIAVDKKMLPVECYEYWHSRIKKEYLDYVHSNIQCMIESGRKIQFEYSWNHPQFGEIMVSCSGRRTADNDGMAVLHGYHKIISNMEGV